MALDSKKVFLVRHGETAWSLSGQHTGVTDIPLTEKGEEEVLFIKKKLSELRIKEIICSPLKRAVQTCEIAGLLGRAHLDPDIAEWNYGQYEGLTTEQIRKIEPHWNIFSNGAPGGESPEDVSLRIRRVFHKIASIEGDVALFSHGHFLRALTALWLTLPIEEGRHFSLSPASLSILSFEREEPVISLWNTFQ